MRTRIKPQALCSSADYFRSRKTHRRFINSEHEKNRDEIERICSQMPATPLTIEEQLSLGRKPYTKCFGKMVPLTASDVKKLQGSVSIYWA